MGCPFERRGHTGISNIFILWNPYRAVRVMQGCRTTPLRTHNEIDTTRICKNPMWASYVVVRGPYGSLTVPHGLFTGCLRSLNPYGTRKLIMHALKPQGKIRTAPHGPREWTYGFVQNSPWTARTGPGSGMGLGHYAVSCQWCVVCNILLY